MKKCSVSKVRYAPVDKCIEKRGASCSAKNRWSVSKQKCVPRTTGNCRSGYKWNTQEGKCKKINCGARKVWSKTKKRCITKKTVRRTVRKCSRSNFYFSVKKAKCTRIPPCVGRKTFNKRLEKCTRR